MTTTYQVPREFVYGGSYVDETLFGESRAKKTAARRRAGQTLVGKKQDVLRMTKQEWNAIVRRANTPLSSFKQEQPKRDVRPHRAPITMLRKEKPTPEQEYERQYREQVAVGGANIRAFNLRNEELDEVKELKSHLEVMRVKAEVDEGLRLKQRRKEEIAHYEHLKDKEMEVIRQRQLREAAKREEERRARNKEAQAHLVAQVAHNQQMQLLEEERLAQENLQMRRHLEKLAAQDEEKKKQQQIAAARRNVELQKSNRMAERYRVIAKEQSEKEDREISEYLAKKAAEEEYRLRQKEKLRQEEELNVARLRAMQEQHQDKRAEEDEKKAQKYQEQVQLRGEEEMAAREKKRRERQAEVQRELDHQNALKHHLAKEEKERDAEYAARIRAEAAAVNRRRDMEERQRMEKREAYKGELVSLMEKREAEKREALRQQREVDERDALAGDVHKHRVNLVIQQKLQDHAQKYPVPARYNPNAEEQQRKRKEAAHKFHKTRPLW